MNKEVHHEGWLIKSPPTKRIWRARWRRRWFTLKQGEIPEQFCLEYYTDRNCRKLKGVIDLDQCEQVDCGLRLENRKQKFQFMFDIKTPKRTYYLAADTETDMGDWVNCICQVCHLHDTNQSNELQGYSVTTSQNAETQNSCATQKKRELNVLSTAVKKSVSHDSLEIDLHLKNSRGSIGFARMKKKKNEQTALLTDKIESANDTFEYTNSDVFSSNYSSKQALYHNTCGAEFFLHSDSVRLAINANGIIRKIPENLVLNTMPLPEYRDSTVQPSPTLSISSGPYISISECFSGSPKPCKDDSNPPTPLNNLDPKFYYTPRSRNNVGLNLTNDQSYSPKITNSTLHASPSKLYSERSSPTDSESVFTDDDEWTYPLPLNENSDRSARPSDSSVENESFTFTYAQRFAKLPDVIKDQQAQQFNFIENDKSVNNGRSESLARDLSQLSDTENTSPVMGPLDSSSSVELSYDIPRSHNLPYYNINNLLDECSNKSDLNTAYAGNKIKSFSFSSCDRPPMFFQPHCYTNAATTQIEGNVFRYDFNEQVDVPPVYRSLKPKIDTQHETLKDLLAKPFSDTYSQTVNEVSKKLKGAYLTCGPSHTTAVLKTSLTPPSVNRSLKPTVYKFPCAKKSVSNHLNSESPLSTLIHNDADAHITENRTLPRHSRNNFATCVFSTSSAVSPTIDLNNGKQTILCASNPQIQKEHKLQYFDLDVANPPTVNRQSNSVGNLLMPGTNRFGISADISTRIPIKSCVVYNSVDFVKTEAFKRIREERKKENEIISKYIPAKPSV